MMTSSKFRICISLLYHRLSEPLHTTQIILEHMLAIEGHVPKNLTGFVPTCAPFARPMFRAIDDRAFIRDSNRAKTWVALEGGIHANNALHVHVIAGLLARLAQNALLQRLFIAHNTARNRVAQAIGAIDQQNFPVAFDNYTGAQDRRDLPQREQRYQAKY